MKYTREQIENQADSEPSDYSDENILRMMLAQLLAENDALREDAARWKEVAFGDSPFLGVVYVDDYSNERWIVGDEAVKMIDAARKAKP